MPHHKSISHIHGKKTNYWILTANTTKIGPCTMCLAMPTFEGFLSLKSGRVLKQYYEM